MNRNVTAIYRTHAVADLVRQGLKDLGVSSGHIHVIPDRDEPVTAGGRRDDSRAMDDLHDLHLPEGDLRTYQSSVRRGDYVVSANVDEDKVARVQEIMRRPEAESYNLDSRDLEFSDEELAAYSAADRDTHPEWLGQRDTASTDPYVRSYRRGAPFGGRTSR